MLREKQTKSMQQELVDANKQGRCRCNLVARIEAEARSPRAPERLVGRAGNRQVHFVTRPAARV
ncbi:MAG: hypothetical protein ACTSRB_12520 [Candidatus Helarchaeota archaeon]